MPDYKENGNDRVPWYYRRDEIKKIVIENGVSNIGELAFYNCSNLTNITIPNSVTRIGKYAFMGCLNLTSITIPNSVTSIGEEAFNDCSSLTSVYITDLIAWCKITFYTNRANPLYYATHLYINGKEADNLVIPNEITKIEDYSFYNCYSLTSITIPNSVTSIGNNAFSGCEGIKEIYSWNNIPPSAYRNSFTSMNTIHAKVFVPEGAVDAYKSNNLTELKL